MVEIKQIRLSKDAINSIFYFLKLINKIIESSSNNNFIYKFKQLTYDLDDNYIGSPFLIKKIYKKGFKRVAYPWFGIDFSKDPLIEIWLNKDDNKFIDELKNSLPEKDDYCVLLRRKDNYYDGLRFMMLPELFNKFNQSDKVEQEKILRDFFNHVNSMIEKYL